MKIVVTGALGHIGSRLIRELPDHVPDDEIVIIDNMATQRYAALFDLPQSGRYRFIEDDVTKMDLEPVFEGARAVVHLAAITDAASSFDNPDEVERVNFGGTKRVAKACARTGTPLIALSTTSVYGTQKDLVDEECSVDELQPQSPYAESKFREEELLRELAGSAGLRHFTARFGTIFGISPGMRFHTAVNKFCWQAVMGQPLAVWRTAYDQKRPYLHLGDAVRAICFVVENELFDGRIYNVLTTNVTVREIVDLIRAKIPDINVEFVDASIMNQLSYEVANKRFTDLGFCFMGSLKEEIHNTLDLLAAANFRTSVGPKKPTDRPVTAAGNQAS